MGLCISFMEIQPEDNFRIGHGCYFRGPFQFTIHDDRIISVNNNCFCSWYFFFYGCTALVGLGRFFSILISTRLVGLLGRAISTSQGCYLHTGQHKQTSMPWVGFEPMIPAFKRLVSPMPSPSAIRDCLFNIFGVTLHIQRLSPSSATWGHAMPWWQGTHLTWIYPVCTVQKGTLQH
jgi:hypothetical protein